MDRYRHTVSPDSSLRVRETLARVSRSSITEMVRQSALGSREAALVDLARRLQGGPELSKDDVKALEDVIRRRKVSYRLANRAATKKK